MQQPGMPRRAGWRAPGCQGPLTGYARRQCFREHICPLFGQEELLAKKPGRLGARLAHLRFIREATSALGSHGPGPRLRRHETSRSQANSTGRMSTIWLLVGFWPLSDLAERGSERPLLGDEPTSWASRSYFRL